uniref:Uncharacterized protein n=1 Tax=Arundo donax TaxID=35708 RepID=A0A0A8YV63_ARUDO
MLGEWGSRLVPNERLRQATQAIRQGRRVTPRV